MQYRLRSKCAHFAFFMLVRHFIYYALKKVRYNVLF